MSESRLFETKRTARKYKIANNLYLTIVQEDTTLILHRVGDCVPPDNYCVY